MAGGTSDDEVIAAFSRELVSRLAPEELPLFPALVSQSRGAADKGAGRDQMLGFGVAESVALVTPVVLQFSRALWEALLSQAAEDTLAVVRKQLIERFRKQKPASTVSVEFTAEQARQVRVIALKQAERLSVPDTQAQLLADAVVGALLSPSP